MNKRDEYIKLILSLCINLKTKEKLVIFCPVEAYEFANATMEKAYEIGATDVEVCYEDKAFANKACALTSCEKPKAFNEWIMARNNYWEKESFKMLWLCTSDYPYYKDVSTEIVEKACCAMPRIFWSTAYVATAQWAQLLYPGKSEVEGLGLLWDAIYSACRIDESCSIENWTKHIASLTNYTEMLNSFKFKSLIFTSSNGTNLTVDLHKSHKWISCAFKADGGQMHISNLPTEEVFTAPMRTGVNGTVIVTSPILYCGEKICNVKLTFKDGIVQEFYSQNNKNALSKLFTENINSNYLGEVALVPKSSAVSKSNLFWYDTSFDENTSCHLAFGNGYADTLVNAQSLTDDEFIQTGLNRCKLHVDFMIGATDMKVVGLTFDNKEVEIMINGEYVSWGQFS